MFLVKGRLLGYTEENRDYRDKTDGSAKSFVSRKIHVIDGVEVHQLELTRDFDRNSIPADGSDVVAEVLPRVSGSRVYWSTPRIVESREPVPAK